MINPTIAWDPTTLFGIDMSRSKCCGKATMKGLRCTRDISLAKQQEIKRLLQKLSSHQPNVAMIDTWLDRLAHCLLCEPMHQDQAENLVDQWEKNFDALIARTRRQYGNYGWDWAMDRTRSQNRELEIEMNRSTQARTRYRQPQNTGPQAATRRSATAAEATRARDRQIPDLVIRQPVSGPADGTEVARDEGIVNSVREELALQVKFEEAGIQATATVNHDSPASPAANRIEDTLGNPIIHRPEMVNIPASDNDASANNNRLEADNILQEAPAPDTTPNLSGECPICLDSIIDRGYLVCCQAYCGRRVIWIEEEDEETPMVEEGDAVDIPLAAPMVEERDAVDIPPAAPMVKAVKLIFNLVKAIARNAVDSLHPLDIEPQLPWREFLSMVAQASLLYILFALFIFSYFLLTPINHNST
ncbi:hypothetical protein G7Y79_00070g096900 [Physcia stellaris]|nr:hypothetical protein G7Y79_00070g096900 [Physcia stellaris]